MQQLIDWKNNMNEYYKNTKYKYDKYFYITGFIAILIMSFITFYTIFYLY